MTTLNSRLQLALLNRKKSRNALEKGFTLVELMIVIIIVGILSAVALPNFLGNRDRAELQTLIKSAVDFSNQCSANILTENPSEIKGIPAKLVTAPAATNGVIKCGTIDNATGIFTSTPTTFTVTGKAGNIEGLICGKDANAQVTAAQRATATNTICTLSVDAEGNVTGLWS